MRTDSFIYKEAAKNAKFASVMWDEIDFPLKIHLFNIYNSTDSITSKWLFSVASCDRSKSLRKLGFTASLYHLALLCWTWFQIILSTDLPELFLFHHNTLLFTITLGQWIFSQGCWSSRFTMYCYCIGSGNTQKPSQNEQQMWTLSCAKW